MRFKSRFYNSLAQGLSGRSEQPVRPPWRGAQCSCIVLRPALALESENSSHESEMVPTTNSILTQRQVLCWYPTSSVKIFLLQST